MDDEAILKELADRFPQHAPQLASLNDQCSAEARMQLIKECGDPTPLRKVETLRAS